MLHIFRIIDPDLTLKKWITRQGSTLYSSMEDDVKEKQYVSDVKYYKYGSAVAIEKGRWLSILRNQRQCVLCLDNPIGDEKHHIIVPLTNKLISGKIL